MSSLFLFSFHSGVFKDSPKCLPWPFCRCERKAVICLRESTDSTVICAICLIHRGRCSLNSASRYVAVVATTKAPNASNMSSNMQGPCEKNYELEKAKAEQGNYSNTSPSPPYASMNGRAPATSPNTAMAAQRKFYPAYAAMGRSEPMPKGIPAGLYPPRVSTAQQLPLVKIEGNPTGRGYAMPAAVGMNAVISNARQQSTEGDEATRKGFSGALVAGFLTPHSTS